MDNSQAGDKPLCAFLVAVTTKKAHGGYAPSEAGGVNRGPYCAASSFARATKPGRAALVTDDELVNATGPGRESDAHDGADVGVRRGDQDVLVEALLRLDRLDEQHAVDEVLDRGVGGSGVEVLAESGPQAGALALCVIVEAGSTELALTIELLDEGVDDLAGRICRQFLAFGLGGVRQIPCGSSA